MSQKQGSGFKRIFFAGLLVTLPLAFSIFLLRWLFIRLDAMFSPAVTNLLIQVGAPLDPDFRLPGLGLLVTILIIFLVGLFTTNFIGQAVVRWYESILTRIPLFKNLYVGAKQVLETFGSSMGSSFRKVVMVEYPRKGIYALAFVTGKAREEVVRVTGQEMTAVFLPTTPNPTSGFLLLVPDDKLTPLEMSIEDGIKMIISAGIYVPTDPLAARVAMEKEAIRQESEGQAQEYRPGG